MKKVILLIAAAFMLGGCSKADVGQFTAIGSKFKVTLYGASQTPIREWISEGKVATETQSDGWYFTDEKTHKLIRVSGNVVVEQL